ncbi:MAG: translation initiation factor IF-2 [Firmicutes bacterium]|nr:translation initiation factor IF-2 [Bacillota bacterium]
MGKTRVYELAQELQLNNKDLVLLLQKVGADVKNHMSTVDDALAERLRASVQQLRRRRQMDQNGPASTAVTAPPAPAEARQAPAPAPAARSQATVSKAEAPAAQGQTAVQAGPVATGRPAGTSTSGPPAAPAAPAARPSAFGPVLARPAATGHTAAPAARPDRRPGAAPTAERGGRGSGPAGREPQPGRRLPEHGYEGRNGEHYGSRPEQRSGERFGRQEGRPDGQFPGRSEGRSGRSEAAGAPATSHAYGSRDMRAPRPEGGAGSGRVRGMERPRPERGGSWADRPPRPPRTREGDGPSRSARPGGGPGFARRGPMAGPATAAKPEERRRQPERRRTTPREYVDRSEQEAEERLQRQQHRRRGQVAYLDRRRAAAKKAANQAASREALMRRGPITLPQQLTVKDLASALGIDAPTLIKKLMELDVMATINQTIDGATAQVVAADLGFETQLAEAHDPETVYMQDVEDPPESLKPRPPVVTIMGHVDHGKTTLLDAIRESRVAASEAGGITQHIGAYQVDLKGRTITFLDTPGHEAFTAMRARGAQVTDIAVLVVAADDGVMPQTVEAINHAKAANVPIIVAINKMDRPDANPDRVKQELADHGLIPEDWGGDTICVPVSALRKEGLDELLEMILLVADMRELKANPDRPARGVVIEAKLDKGRGPVATVLVQKGTLHLGDAVVIGTVAGRVRAMLDYRGQPVEEAFPSMPVELVGLADVPQAGDTMAVTDDEKIARMVANARHQKQREEIIKKTARVRLEDVLSKIKEGEVKSLNVVLKADVQGSLEALGPSLERLSNDEVRVRVIHSGVGAVTESDVMLAAASNAIIIGFNVRPDAAAKRVAERENVDIRSYRIIYEAIDDVKAAISGMLAPELKESTIGKAEVRALFRIPKVGVIAGCYVNSGKITRNASVRVLRDNVVVHEGKVASLRHLKDDVREVSEGFECGIGLQNFQDLKEGDVLEAFVVEEVQREAE